MAVSLHGNNGLVTTNGTAAAPSLAAPDTDTGLYFGTNLIHATTSGSERFRIQADGNILLQGGKIYGEDAATNTFTLQSTSGNANHSRIEIGVIQNSDNGGINFYTAGSSAAEKRLTIKGTSGSVGIGDDNPTFSAINSISANAARGIEIHKNGTDTGSAIKLAGDNGSGTKAWSQLGYSGANATAHWANYNTSGTKLGEILIGSTGNIGIGDRTSSPDADLHVHTASGESTIHVEGATNANLNLRSHSGDSTVKFSDASASNIGNINYDHATDSLSFRVNASPRLTITSGGNVQIDNDSGKFELGNDQDISFYHTGTHGFLENDTGTFYIKSDTISLNKANGNNVMWTNGSEMRFYPSDYGFGGAVPGGNPAGKAVFLAIGDSDTGIVQDGDGQLEIWGNNNEVANFNAIDGYTSTKLITTSNNMTMGGRLIHYGDTDTYMEYTDNQIEFVTGGSSRMYANNYAVYVRSGFPLAFLSSSGATPNIKSGGTNNQDLLFTSGSGNPTRLQVHSDGRIGVNAGGTTALTSLDIRHHNGTAGSASGPSTVVTICAGRNSSRGMEIKTGRPTSGNQNDAAVYYNAKDTESSTYHAQHIWQLGGTNRMVLGYTGGGAKLGVGTDTPDGRNGSIDISSTDTTAWNPTSDQRSEASLTLRNPSANTNTFTALHFFNGGGTGTDITLAAVRKANFEADFHVMRRINNAGSGNDNRASVTMRGLNTGPRVIIWAEGDGDNNGDQQCGNHIFESQQRPGFNQYVYWNFKVGSASYSRAGSFRYHCTWSTGHASGSGYQIGTVLWINNHNSNGTCDVREHLVYRRRYNNGHHYGWTSAPELEIFQSNNTATNASIIIRCQGHGSHNSNSYDMSTVVHLHIEHMSVAQNSITPRLERFGTSSVSGTGSGVSGDRLGYCTFSDSAPTANTTDF